MSKMKEIWAEEQETAAEIEAEDCDFTNYSQSVMTEFDQWLAEMTAAAAGVKEPRNG